MDTLEGTLVGGYVVSGAVDADGNLDLFVVPVDPALNVFHVSIKDGVGSYTALAQTSPQAVEKVDEASGLLPKGYAAQAESAALSQAQQRRVDRIEELQNELTFLTKDVAVKAAEITAAAEVVAEDG